MVRRDGVFVERTFQDIGNEAGPDAGVRALEIPGARRPAIEIANDGDFAGVGRPDGEMRAAHAVLLDEMSAKFLVEPMVLAFAQEIAIEVGEKRRRGTIL